MFLLWVYVCVCHQNVVQEIPTVAGTTTESVLSTLPGVYQVLSVCLSVCGQILFCVTVSQDVFTTLQRVCSCYYIIKCLHVIV